MNLDYIYVEDGNNLETLIHTFYDVKDINHPIVVHINTQKGKGYQIAEENKENWHWCMPFDIETGKPKVTFEGENYGDLTADYLLYKMKKDSKVVALVAGVPTNIGFTKDKRERAGKQFVDVGIAEEHAIAMASGIAKNGGKPVFATHSSFMQRTYDQLSQDLCVNNNPATILVNTASVYGMNDVTHLGLYDIAMMSNIPNLVYLAPTSKEEYFAMLDWSIEQDKYPVAIRIPCNGVISDNREVQKDYSNLNKYKIERQGNKVAVIALGDFYQLGEQITNKIKEKFILREVKENYKPDKKGHMGMFLNDKWYEIEFGKEYLDKKDVVETLDISILQQYILDEILGIKNPRTDKRIDFIGGIRGAKEIERRVKEDMKVGFLMYPTHINELISVADANEIMPAKSTWFEPKVRCGLFLHELN